MEEKQLEGIAGGVKTVVHIGDDDSVLGAVIENEGKGTIIGRTPDGKVSVNKIDLNKD